ncbi:MAG: hypothetical protein FD163_2504 [Hyphomonadaceae bacterium]|nr:MAG: hypothetical protein FD128_1687 [Hyphomonadaceae bacterium]KAF0182714.1 MAG: hypothetical protein FD163_2504 [Hyphomonadaceae bacterium]
MIRRSKIHLFPFTIHLNQISLLDWFAIVISALAIICVAGLFL